MEQTYDRLHAFFEARTIQYFAELNAFHHTAQTELEELFTLPLTESETRSRVEEIGSHFCKKSLNAMVLLIEAILRESSQIMEEVAADSEDVTAAEAIRTDMEGIIEANIARVYQEMAQTIDAAADHGLIARDVADTAVNDAVTRLELNQIRMTH